MCNCLIVTATVILPEIWAVSSSSCVSADCFLAWLLTHCHCLDQLLWDRGAEWQRCNFISHRQGWAQWTTLDNCAQIWPCQQPLKVGQCSVFMIAELYNVCTRVGSEKLKMTCSYEHVFIYLCGLWKEFSGWLICSCSIGLMNWGDLEQTEGAFSVNITSSYRICGGVQIIWCTRRAESQCTHL